MLAHLPPETLLAIAQRVVSKKLAAGQHLDLRGEQAQVLCIAASGRLHVETRYRWEENAHATLTAGQWAGQELVLGWQRALNTRILAGRGGAEVLLLWKRDLAAVSLFRVAVPVVHLLAALRTVLENGLTLLLDLPARAWHSATSNMLAHPVVSGSLLALCICLAIVFTTVPGKRLRADGYYLWLKSRAVVPAPEEVMHLSRIMEIAPTHPQAAVELGNIAARSGDPEAARHYYEPVADTNPVGANNLGALLLQEGDVRGAVAALQVAWTLESNVAVIYQNLGVASGMMDREEQSLRFFREALHIDPALGTARYHLGLDSLRHGDLVRAAAAFDRVVEKDPTCAPAYVSLGLVQRQIGDLERAADAFEQAATYDPGSAVARFHLGWTQLEMGYIGKARANLTALLKEELPRDLADRVRILLARR